MVTASAVEARKDAERSQRNLKELEEQIQNDDRLELVEASLKNTQERSDELEFQLSRLKHVCVQKFHSCAVLYATHRLIPSLKPRKRYLMLSCQSSQIRTSS